MGRAEGDPSSQESLFGYLQSLFNEPVRDETGRAIRVPMTLLGERLWQVRHRTLGRTALPETAVLSEDVLDVDLYRSQDGSVRVGFYLSDDNRPFNLYVYDGEGAMMVIGTNTYHPLPESHFGAMEKLLRATEPVQVKPNAATFKG